MKFNPTHSLSLCLALAASACNEPPTTQKAAAASASVQPAQDVVSVAPDATKAASGWSWKLVEPGTGEKRAKSNDIIRVEFTAWGKDGKEFNSSKRMGRPSRLNVSGLSKGLAEAVAEMAPGEKRRLWFPAEHVAAGWPNGPAGESITVDLKLVEVIEGPKPIPVPEDVAAAPKDAKKTKSGLFSKVLKPGTGKAHPKASETVQVHYSGWTTDGKMFDSSEARGKPTSFPLSGVIKGWTEGVQLMVEGERRRFWIPEDLAYKGQSGPQGTLVFDIELLKIVRPPETPKDVAKPPADAQKTKSGLASKVLKPGTGAKHPTATSRVRVDYSGWTTDGKMFDSSVQRGEPATFGLNQVIAGWTEGLQLMVPGEQRRFWIPEELAYKGKPGAPKGMLVFDVELLEVE